MDLYLVLALTACALCAGLVYVILQVRHFGETQGLQGQLLLVQDELAKVKKSLEGHTAYGKFVESARKAMVEALKSPVAVVTREVTHVEPVSKDIYKLKADATVVATYTVDFAFALDTSTAGLELTDSGTSLLVRLSKPTLQGDGTIRSTAKQVISAAPLVDDKAVLADAHARAVVRIKRMGSALANDDGLRALCKLKAAEALRDHLARQNGVRSVPAIVVEFK